MDIMPASLRKDGIVELVAPLATPTPFCLADRIREVGLDAKEMPRKDIVAAIDALAADPNVTLDTFAHLNATKILHRVDWHLLPMLTLLYLLCFMDRTNVANAAIEGMIPDLHLTGNRLNLAVLAFLFSFVALEVPSNIALLRIRPSLYLPSLMVAWGMVLTLSGLMTSFAGFIITRVFLGLAEGRLYPGITYLNTRWYCRHEIQLRQSYVFSAAAVAGVFSGLLAYAISFMRGISSFLSIQERIFLVHRLRYDNPAADLPSANSKKHLFRSTLFDPQIYLCILLYWGYDAPLYGITLYVPLIITEMGYTSVVAQLITVPIFALSALTTLGVAHASDRLRMRSPFIFGCLVLQLVGFGICIGVRSAVGTYAGLAIVAAGCYPCQPANMTWLSNNIDEPRKRAVAIAMLIALGDLGGAAIASTFYKVGWDYDKGHVQEMGMICLGLEATAVQAGRYMWLNRRLASASDTNILGAWRFTM